MRIACLGVSVSARDRYARGFYASSRIDDIAVLLQQALEQTRMGRLVIDDEYPGCFDTGVMWECHSAPVVVEDPASVFLGSGAPTPRWQLDRG